MKKVIIGIHGLGNKPPKDLLQKWWREAMLEGMHTQGVNKKMPVFEMVYWADILYEKPLNKLETDTEDPFYLNEPYTIAPESVEIEDYTLREKLTDFISEQLNKILLNEDKSLNYSFVTDAILKKYFRDLDVYYAEESKNDHNSSNEARELIRNRFAQVVSKYKGYEILIVAHSMGSIIAFDVLNFLIPEKEISTLVTIGSPLGFPVVVSKIAAEQNRTQNGKSLMATPPGITANWFNMADITDHVALNFKLADDFIPNEREISPKDFLVQNNYQVNEKNNPHKSFGYLRTPEFTTIISDFIGEEKPNVAQKVFIKLKVIIRLLKEQYLKLRDRLKANEKGI